MNESIQRKLLKGLASIPQRKLLGNKKAKVCFYCGLPRILHPAHVIRNQTPYVEGRFKVLELNDVRTQVNA